VAIAFCINPSTEHAPGAWESADLCRAQQKSEWVSIEVIDRIDNRRQTKSRKFACAQFLLTVNYLQAKLWKLKFVSGLFDLSLGQILVFKN